MFAAYVFRVYFGFVVTQINIEKFEFTEKLSATILSLVSMKYAHGSFGTPPMNGPSCSISPVLTACA